MNLLKCKNLSKLEKFQDGQAEGLANCVSVNAIGINTCTLWSAGSIMHAHPDFHQWF